MCGSRKCPNFPHRRGGKFLMVVGSQRSKPLKISMKLNWNFQGGGGLMKNPFCGIGKDNLSNYTIQPGAEYLMKFRVFR